MTTPSPTSLSKQGKILMDLQRYADAEKKFAEALVKDPRDAYAHWGLGISNYKQGREVDGVKIWEQGLAQHPDDSDNFYHSLAIHHLNYQRYAQGLKYAEEWLKHSPDEPIAHMDKAKIMLRAGSKDVKTIEQHAREARRIGSYDERTAELMAEVLWDIKRDKQAAIEEFEYAIKLNPHDAHIRNNFGVMLLESGDAHRALEEFRMTIQINPNLQISADNLGRALASTHPALSLTYKLAVFTDQIPILRYLNAFAIYFILRSTVRLARALGGLVALVVLIVASVYVVFTVYSFFGYRIFMFAFRKGWIK